MAKLSFYSEDLKTRINLRHSNEEVLEHVRRALSAQDRQKGYPGNNWEIVSDAEAKRTRPVPYGPDLDKLF